jgi:ABC-type multidrug transport system ATPase subunit
MLRIEGLAIGRKRPALAENLGLSCPRGSLTLIVGANGAGKTTLLETLAGRLPALAGKLSLDARTVDPASPSWRGRRVYVPASGGFLAEFGAAEQLTLRGVLLGLAEEEAGRRADALLAGFGLTAHAGKRGGELSTGYQRRLALALALVGRTDLVLLDEPFNALDLEGAAALQAALAAAKAAGAIVLVASHLAEPLAALADARFAVGPAPVQAPPAAAAAYSWLGASGR